MKVSKKDIANQFFEIFHTKYGFLTLFVRANCLASIFW